MDQLFPEQMGTLEIERTVKSGILLTCATAQKVWPVLQSAASARVRKIGQMQSQGGGKLWMAEQTGVFRKTAKVSMANYDSWRT